VRGEAHPNLDKLHDNSPLLILLKYINRFYETIIENLINPPELGPSFFLPRSHASHLGAVRLVLSGQLPESYMLLRGCLENALYGFYISGRPGIFEIWLRRHDDEQSKDRVKNQFQIGKDIEILGVS
jgi:hypothetical protein